MTETADPVAELEPATDTTALAVRRSVEQVETALTEFDKVSAGIDELRQRYGKVAFAVTTSKGMAEATAARLAIREPRYAVEKVRKAAKAPVLALGRDIDARAAYITDELLAIEQPIHEQIQAEEGRREADRQAKAEAERQRVAGIQQRVNAIAAVAARAVGKPAADIERRIQLVVAQAVDAVTFAEFADRAQQVQADTLATLRELHAATLAQEAEAARVAEERAQMERERAQQAERDRVERERVAAEQRAAEERLAAQRAEMRRQQEAHEAELRAQREAQARADADAAAARAEADRQAAEARRIEESRIAEARAALEREQAAARAEDERRAHETAAAEQPAPSPAADLFAAPAEASSAPAKEPEAEKPMLKLGTMADRLGFVLTRAFVEQVLQMPAAQVGSAFLWRESDWPRIKAGIVRHVEFLA